jgi:hypothetical protein
MADTNDKIAAAAGVSREVVERVLTAQLAFQFAIGIASPDDEGIGVKVRDKYPDLLRASVATTAGRSPATPVTFELEATIVQLESGESPSNVVAVIAAQSDILGLVSSEDYAEYRDWAAKWTKGTPLN